MNKIFKKNKKGTDKILSVYWFAILFIVAAAIVYMVILFYGKPYDVREIESRILTNQIADCLSEGGYLKENILGNEDFKNNFLKECHLNFDVEDVYDWKELGQYYIEIKFYDFNQNLDLNFDISEGNINLKENCDKEGENFPFCSERSFYTLDKNNKNKQYEIKILSIVRKTEKNV